MQEAIGEHDGRTLFGGDTSNYHSIRPAYPEAIYQLLRETGALRPNVATLELGAGNGLATRRLLELGANPLTALEPDARFAPLLRSLPVPAGVSFVHEQVAFEQAALPARSYDLIVAATSFHWLDPALRLRKAAELLRPGGHLALWWNVFGDPERADPFHEATLALLQPLSRSPSDRQPMPFALDRQARHREIMQSGAFEAPLYAAYYWTLRLTTEQVGALYATYSAVSRLHDEPRQALLHGLMEIAEREFGGQVERNMVSPIYIARRREQEV